MRYQLIHILGILLVLLGCESSHNIGEGILVEEFPIELLKNEQGRKVWFYHSKLDLDR